MKTYQHYINILENSSHILIGGSTGSGKSVLLNNLIYTNILIHPQDQYIFIDTKRIELIQYKRIKQTFIYTDSINGTLEVLKEALNIINHRYKLMQVMRLKEYGGSRLYIIIDELADIMTSCHKKQITAYLQRILQIGRASKVYIIACTQSVHYSIIPTYLKINFNTIIGLKVRNKKDSNLLIDRPGCEALPQYGKFILLFNSEYIMYNNYMIDQNDINKLIQQNNKKSLLKHFIK